MFKGTCLEKENVMNLRKCVAVAALFVFAGSVQAVTYYFDGGPLGTGTDFGVSENWSGDTVPGIRARLFFCER